MRWLIAILVVLYMLLPPPVMAAEPCHEDQPCFVWSKQGNKQRGVTVAGKLRVVGPCTYAKLAHAKRLDASNVKLRGDVWAHWHCD